MLRTKTLKSTAESDTISISALEVFLAKILVRAILAALSSASSMRSQNQLARSSADRTIFKASCRLAKAAAGRAFLAFTRISMTSMLHNLLIMVFKSGEIRTGDHTQTGSHRMSREALGT